MKFIIRLLLTLTLALVLCPLTFFAQDYAYKGGAYGGVGGGGFFDDEGSLGRGLTYRTGVEWRPLSRLGVEAELLGIHHTRSDYFEVSGNALSLSGNAVYYFSRSRIQPYVLCGLGLIKADYRYSWPGTTNGEFHKSTTEPAFNFGLGIRLFVSRRWSLDPQFRLAVSSPSYYAIGNYFSTSLAYHW